MLRMNGMKMGMMVLVTAAMAGAHLSADGMKPTAGESLNPGTTYKITWKVAVLHNGSNIDLSSNGGQTWTTIKENFQEVSGTNNFNWTVAGAATQTAKIRICQHGGNKACKDTDRTNLLSSTTAEGNYVLISPTFTIATVTGLSQPAASQSAFVLDFNPDTRNVNVSFALAETGPVLLQAFDARGRLAATLAQDEFTAGEHKLSLFSNALAANGGSLVFKLKVGGQIHSRIWTSAH
jgi:hypothetical protein